MRGQARRQSVPSTRPPTVNPPRTWSTAICPPNKSSAYNGTWAPHKTTTDNDDNKKRCCSSISTNRKKTDGGGAYLGDVTEEDFGGSFDALEAHDDAGAPARLCELHASGVDPYAGAAHVRSAPLVRTRVALDGAARETREFHRVAREGDACDARVQCGEKERLEQRGLACVRV